MTDRVLLIGKRASVLTRLQAALRDVGIEADRTQEVRDAEHVQLSRYAAVAFGRAVSEADRARTKDAFRTANPDVVFVDGLAPITPLLVAQFEEALDRRPDTARKLGNIVAARGRLELDVRAPTHVQATAFRLTRLYRTRTTRLLDDELPAGPKTIVLPTSLARSREAFAVIRADKDEVRVLAPAP